MLPLCVLVWGHFIVRRRRYLHTPFEMISTILGVFILFCIKGGLFMFDEIDLDSMTTTDKLISDDYPMQAISSPSLVYYTPVTRDTTALMQQVGQKLGLREIQHVPGEFDYSGVYGVHNSSPNLRRFSEKLGDYDAFVIFEDSTNVPLESLNYTIRIKSDLNRPHKGTDTLYETFLRLQWAIDSSFIERRSGTGIPKGLNLVCLKSSKGLGVIHDRKLLFEEHINTAVDRAYKALGFIIRVSIVLMFAVIWNMPPRYGIPAMIAIITKLRKSRNVTFHEVPATDKKKIKISVIIIFFFLVLFSRIALLIPFVSLMSKYIEEKVTGHQELLRMNGVPKRTVLAGHLINMLPTGLCFSLIAAMFLKITSTPLIQYTSYGILALVYFLHFYALMQWAVLCTFIINTEKYVTAKSALLGLVLIVPSFIVLVYSTEWHRAGVFFACCFVPYFPLDVFYTILLTMELDKTSNNFSNMWPNDELNRSVFEVMLSLVVQFVLLGCLVLWLSRLLPGPYGVPEPWSNAIPFCNKIIKRKETAPLEQVSIPRDPKYFETPPQKEIGIRICHVTKVFGTGTKSFQALTNVSFDIYRGEIMVLLGHNGAGKTTLLSILTGMIPSNAGKIYVSGQDVDKFKSKVRKEMGYCTQHNTFISYLTILEQVRFWSMLKGHGFKEAKTSSLLLLEELNISDKAHYKSQQLSGGMKRRLQLACALGGGTTVLILDEPTSGLDVETRRQLWDLLLSLRGTRTIVLTTHYMEEADALGDRVAALHEGILKCHATPMHLKKNIGTGYRLTLMTRGHPREDEITPIVTSMVSGANLKDKTAIQVTYDLPAEETAKFPELFETLEGKQEELDIESIGVSMPSLEEVFLKLCSNVEADFTENQQMAGMHMADYKKNTGFALYLNQAVVLFKRHLYYMLDKKWAFLFYNIVVAILLIFAMIYVHYVWMPETKSKSNNTKLLDDSFRHPIFRRTFDVNALMGTDWTHRETMADSLADIKVKEIWDQGDEIIQKGKMQLIHNDDYLAELLLNSTHAKIMFKKGMYGMASTALNLLSNMLAGGQSKGTRRAIQTSHQPVATVQAVPQLPEPTPVPSTDEIGSSLSFLVLIFFIMIANASSIACKEQQSGTRSIYIMSGCSMPVFWIVRLLYYLLFYMLTLFLPLVIAFLCFELSRRMWTFEPIVVLAIVFLCGCGAWLSFVFLLSLCASERIVTFSSLAIVIVCGFFIASAAQGLATQKTTSGLANIFSNIFNVMMYVVTPGTFSMAFFWTALVAQANAYCDVNRHLCPLLLPSNEPFDYTKCCIDKKRVAEYFSFSKYSPLSHILMLIVHFIIFTILLVLIDMGWFQNKCKRSYNQPPPQFKDPLVNAEKAYVHTTFTKRKNEIQDVMLVNNLHKKFWSKKIPVVRGVSFSVKQGECFGVLGVNGAGKTTTFRMIVAEISASHGACFANKHFLSSERQAYLRSLSYCPQFLGLDMFLTGYQNLKTLLTIIGLKKEDIEKEINLCFDVVGLKKYRNKKVSEYSGGCMRRLAAGTALSSGAAVTLLDEPTCGVDVAARRRVWANIKQSLDQGRAVIITSHSMDEMETLSNRLMIMARGEVRLLGSPGAVRASHAAGHSVVLKLAPTVPTDGGAGVQELKDEMNRIFNCTLKDQHHTMLHYHINENINNSELFREMENLKANFSHLIEDYSVSATSLEEVFLAIAQETSAQPKPITNTGMKQVKQETKGVKGQTGNKQQKGKKKRRADMCESCEGP